MALGTVNWINVDKGTGSSLRMTARLFMRFLDINGAGFRSLDEPQPIEFQVRGREAVTCPVAPPQPLSSAGVVS